MATARVRSQRIVSWIVIGGAKHRRMQQPKSQTSKLPFLIYRSLWAFTKLPRAILKYRNCCASLYEYVPAKNWAFHQFSRSVPFHWKFQSLFEKFMTANESMMSLPIKCMQLLTERKLSKLTENKPLIFFKMIFIRWKTQWKQ